MDPGGARTGREHRDILSAVGFGAQWYQGFLMIVRRLGVGIEAEPAAAGRQNRLIFGFLFRIRRAMLGVAVAIDVGQGGVWLAIQCQRRLRPRIAVSIVRHHFAEDRVPACGVAGDHQRVAVVGRYEYQRVGRVRHCQRTFDRSGQFDGFRECAICIAGVVRVIDSTGFDHQHEALVVCLQTRDRSFGHVHQARYCGRPILHVGHMRCREQTQQMG